MRLGLIALIVVALLTGHTHAGGDQGLTQCEDLSIDPQERIAACNRVIASDTVDKKDRAGAYASRAGAHMGEGRYVEAIADFDQAIALRPDQPDYYCGRGLQFDMLKDRDRALADYEKGFALTPDNICLLGARASLFLAKGEDARAFADLDKVIALGPANPHPYWIKARAYVTRGQSEKALAVLDQGIGMKPDNVKLTEKEIGMYDELYSLRAEMHRERGDNEKELADLNRQIEIAPIWQSPFLHRALLYERLGKLDLAIADYDKLLSFAPDEPFYRDRRKALLDSKGATSAPAHSPKPRDPTSSHPKETTPAPAAPPPARATESAAPPAPKATSKKKLTERAECRVFVAAANITVSIACSK